MQTEPEISRDRNLFLMYQPKYFSRHMLAVADAVRPDTILYIEPFDAPHDEVAARQIRLTDFPTDQFKNSRVFLFDYFSRPVSKIAQILYAQGAEIIFVQHGSISHLEVEIQTGAKRIFWKRFWHRMSIMAQIARLAWRTGQLCLLRSNQRKVDTRLLQSAFVFIAEDAAFFEDLGEGCVICQSADAKKFQFDLQAGTTFISQPLIEDRLVDSRAYLALFDSLVDSHGVTRVIAHPRDRALAAHARRKGLAVSALKDQTVFAASSILGHYSTLLHEIHGVDVIRVDYSDGTELERFWGAARDEALVIVDELERRYRAQSKKSHMVNQLAVNRNPIFPNN